MSETKKDEWEIILSQAEALEDLLEEQSSQTKPNNNPKPIPPKTFFPNKASIFALIPRRTFSSSTQLISSSISDGNLAKEDDQKTPKLKTISSNSVSISMKKKSYFIKNHLRVPGMFRKSPKRHSKTEQNLMEKTHRRLLNTETYEESYLSRIREKHRQFKFTPQSVEWEEHEEDVRQFRILSFLERFKELEENRDWKQ